MPVIKRKEDMPSLDGLMEGIVREGEGRIGMVLTHVGVVRGTSRNGARVKGVKVRVDETRLSEILAEARKKEGIFYVEAFLREGMLSVGEVLMILAVAGDFRENVIDTLRATLDAIKAQVTTKEELPEE